MNDPPTPFIFICISLEILHKTKEKEKRKKKMLVHGCSRVAQLTRTNAHACRVTAASPQH